MLLSHGVSAEPAPRARPHHPTAHGALHPADLHMIVVISNPMMYESRARLAQKFLARMKRTGATIWIVESRTGDRDYEVATDPNNPHHIRLYGDHVLWLKEAMAQVALSRLPHDARYVALVDSDLQFMEEDVAMETLHALQLHNAVQMWSHAVDMDRTGAVKSVHKSYAYLWEQGTRPTNSVMSGYEVMHPGYAWAWKLEPLRRCGGFIKTGIMGAGDTHMALAMSGLAQMSIQKGVHPNYAKPILRWGELADQHIQRNLGYVPGTIFHEYHGDKADRKYHDRWQILVEHQFDPEVDIVWDHQGLPMWAGNKPDLRDASMRYYKVRREDAGEGRHYV